LLKILERRGDDVTQGVKKDLETLTSREYFLDKIISIEHVPYKGYVYDIYVPREHNFIAEGVIVHNCIDEFDKMSGEDRKALHEAMEQLTVSIAKAGIVATLNARTSILAAANPKLGRYNEQRSISENINLPPTIISRFDLIFVMKDVPDAEGDKLKTRHVLGLHAGDVRVEPPIPPGLLKKYIMYARENVFPKLTEAAAKKIEEFYLKMRSMSAKEKKEGFEESPIAITTRQLEALVRLAEAHARMLLKDEVDEEDAQFAIDLVKYSLEQVGKDPESGEIDTGVIYTGVSHTKRSRYYQVIEIIKNLEREEEYKDGVPIRKILEVAKERGIQEDFVIEVIRREVQSGNIYEPKSGRYKLIY
jgi:replicative DNA helicase Mcm